MLTAIFLFLDSLGGGELLVILFFILIFFGSKKIPDLAKGLGRGMREFRNAMNDVRSEIEHASQPDPPKAINTESNPEKLKTDTPSANPEEPVNR